MEAMASGIPVISSNISGIPELVIDKETGLLVAPKDAKELANKILELLKNNILREQLAKKGRLKIEQEFDIEKNTNLLIDLFKDSSVN
jgi:glycosyltransferase involved in cell wall biosynthesis